MISAVALTSCLAPINPELKAPTPTHWRNATNEPDVDAAQKDWWLLLSDDVLNDAIALALKQNFTLGQAKERLKAAEAFQHSTEATMKPQVGFMAGPDSLSRPSKTVSADQSIVRTSGAFIAGFDLIWEIPIFGLGDAQRKLTSANIKTATTDIHLAKNNIVVEVIRAYGDLRASQEKLHHFDTVMLNYENLSELTKKGKEVGLLAESDQDLSRKALADAEDAKLNAFMLSESSLQRLRVLCGLATPLPSWLDLGDSPWVISRADKPALTLPAKLIQIRPDVQRAESLVMSAAGDLGIARADLYPKLNLEGALMLAGNLSGSSRSSQSITFLAPSIRLPIVDWGLARQIVNAREAKLREAVLAYQETVLIAIEETEDALANFNVAERRQTRTEKELTLLRQKSGKIQAAYNAGYLSRPELLNIEIKVLEQELQAIDTKVAWLNAFALVNKSFGNGSSL
ncbi:TolC family protein [Methylotenera sp.]|uniref:TolC family protein n=1 Tax=Methylotenera sp. TaxID=2051956 RepID=UPI002488BDCF|nr:TolC family protein [Methylotenera sp.]MDI1298315.1 TolC family protein [Methylotenera sp.]